MANFALVKCKIRSLPAVAWRAAGVALEVDSEGGLVGKVEVVGDLLDGVLAAAEHGFGLQENVVADPVGGVSSGLCEDDMDQVLGGEAEAVGVLDVGENELAHSTAEYMEVDFDNVLPPP